MGALTRTNTIHASHLLASSYEKGWPWHPLWDTQQRTIIHRTAKQQGVAELGSSYGPQLSAFAHILGMGMVGLSLQWHLESWQLRLGKPASCNLSEVDEENLC